MAKRLLFVGMLSVCVAVMPLPLLAQQASTPQDGTLKSLQERMDALERENQRLERLIDRQSGVKRAGADDDLIQDPLQQPEQPSVLEPGPFLTPQSAGAHEYVIDPEVAAAESAYSSFVERLGTRYNEGFLLVESPDPERVPFQLKFNLFNQFRYLNQNLDESTFTDHLGNVYPVDARNDINMNRNLYYFGGYVFDQRMIYNIIIWSSNSVATVIQGGYIGYQFDEAFTLYGGYWGIPGSRSNTRDFMFLTGVERSMADSFFRPGFTQGIWCEGKAADDLYYVGYIGNSMNTLNVSTSKVDKNFIYAGSAWWEPLGDYAPPGAYRMAYSDLEYHESPAIRLGTSMTGAREDRFSNPATNPENVALYNSDGVLTFSTGAFAPGVTMQYVNSYMWAQDIGFKYRGLAINGQYFMRWLNNFKADGPIPMNETFDHGFEASIGYFVVPQTLEIYGRASAVYGEFRDSNEWAIGSNWHPWQNRGFRLISEVNKVENSPTSSIQTIYNAGMSGWNVVLQTQLYF